MIIDCCTNEGKQTNYTSKHQKHCQCHNYLLEICLDFFIR